MNTKDCECMSEMTGTIVASPIVLPSVVLFILRSGWVGLEGTTKAWGENESILRLRLLHYTTKLHIDIVSSCSL